MVMIMVKMEPVRGAGTPAISCDYKAVELTSSNLRLFSSVSKKISTVATNMTSYQKNQNDNLNWVLDKAGGRKYSTDMFLYSSGKKTDRES